MELLLIGIAGFALGCAGIVLVAWIITKNKEEEDRKHVLYCDLCKQFYDMIDESPNDVPVPYETYEEMRALIARMRYSIVNSKVV